MSVPSLIGSLYYVLFHDDATGFRVIYFLKTKGEVIHYFQIYAARIFSETGHRISILRSDNGGGNILTVISNIILPQMVFGMRRVLRTHQNKMVSVNAPIEH